ELRVVGGDDDEVVGGERTGRRAAFPVVPRGAPQPLHGGEHGGCLLGRVGGVAVVGNRHGVESGGDAREHPLLGHRMGAEGAVVAEPRHDAREGGVHAAALGEEVAVRGGQHVVAVADVAEGGTVDGGRVHAL